MKEDFDIRDYIHLLGDKTPEGKYHCPFCGGHNLSVAKDSPAFNCYNCEDTGAITKAVLEMAKEYSPSDRFRKTYKSVQATNYFYLDRNGSPLVKVVRKDKDFGQKEFFQYRYDADSRTYVNKIKGFVSRTDIPIYRYQEVRKAIADGQTIFIVEGEACVDALWKLGIAATCNIGGSGKWEDSDSHDLKDAQQIVICPDRDWSGIKHGDRIFKDFLEAKWLYAYPESLLWNRLNKSGGVDVYDWIKDFKLTSEDIFQAIEDSRRDIEKNNEAKKGQQREVAKKKPGRPKKRPDESEIALDILPQFQDKFLYISDLKIWMQYEIKHLGVWTEVDSDIPTDEVERFLDEQGIGYTANYTSGITKILRRKVRVDKDEINKKSSKKIAFLNCVLDLKTKNILSHHPRHYNTSCLPYNYAPSDTLCGPILHWLRERVNGAEDVMMLLRCYLKAIVTGRTDLQKYLELIGPGGSGKSTFINLAVALVGQENIHSTEFKRLENNKFELAALQGKKLLQVTDAEKHNGSAALLKSITGDDMIPVEKKYHDVGKFKPQCMCIFAANKIPSSEDITSGLARRRITVYFKNQVDNKNQDDLFKIDSDMIGGDFAPYIPAFFNWILGVSDDDVFNYLKRTEEFVPSLDAERSETLCLVNQVADWVNSNLVLREGHRTSVGVAKPDKDPGSKSRYLHVSEWLYPNYRDYTDSVGKRPLSLRSFVSMLEDLIFYQLKDKLGDLVKRGKDRASSFFEGIKLRQNFDRDDALIDSLFIPSATTELTDVSSETSDIQDEAGIGAKEGTTESVFPVSETSFEVGDRVVDFSEDLEGVIIKKDRQQPFPYLLKLDNGCEHRTSLDFLDFVPNEEDLTLASQYNCNIYFAGRELASIIGKMLRFFLEGEIDIYNQSPDKWNSAFRMACQYLISCCGESGSKVVKQIKEIKAKNSS
ncbi:phage/plasmid primase, P4 family [Okeania sp. SIO1I7]|uniref:phage/plasmid primase, P4 family n=1 Tax=Okeania sp. SIO1I7 TaxID=2607772 RepID=UPI0013FC594D|nr:phage/plasmid primase, P4 family [Okeania sp. SIO1I7]NET29524.1 hypothetical protein [Okeania sp. SIO1I7]